MRAPGPKNWAQRGPGVPRGKFGGVGEKKKGRGPQKYKTRGGGWLKAIPRGVFWALWGPFTEGPKGGKLKGSPIITRKTGGEKRAPFLKILGNENKGKGEIGEKREKTGVFREKGPPQTPKKEGVFLGGVFGGFGGQGGAYIRGKKPESF